MYLFVYLTIKNGVIGLHGRPAGQSCKSHVQKGGVSSASGQEPSV